MRQLQNHTVGLLLLHIRKVVSALVSVTERKLSHAELYKVESHISDRLDCVAGAWKYLGKRKNWHAKFLRPLLPIAPAPNLYSRVTPFRAPYFLSNGKHPRCDCMLTITYLMCFFSFFFIEASPNEAPKGHERNLLSVVLAFMLIVFVH